MRTRSLLPTPSLRPGARPRGPLPDHLAPVAASGTQRRATHMAASVLLAYPDDDVLAAMPAVRAATPGLPAAVRERFDAFCDLLGAADLGDLRARYVATFDLKRKCSMYLSYYAAGDTRRRGTALVAFVEAYRAAGWEVTGSELPDYLPTVLEFSARATGDDAAIAAGLLAAHRDGIEVLRTALESVASPWTGLVEAVCLTLPPLDERTQQRYVELVTAGPPAELVGMEPVALEPYGPAPGPALGRGTPREVAR
ncbi:respiratory nitrate reductase chaperone NarJ [Cellulosimicrobium cellulans J1]|nr:respiratory nitrate reductase chaperone NarJ [Cellulosimicrobium cellulans J1]